MARQRVHPLVERVLRIEEGQEHIKQKMDETDVEDLNERVNDLEAKHEEIVEKTDDLESRVTDVEDQVTSVDEQAYNLEGGSLASKTSMVTTASGLMSMRIRSLGESQIDELKSQGA